MGAARRSKRMTTRYLSLNPVEESYIRARLSADPVPCKERNLLFLCVRREWNEAGIFLPLKRTMGGAHLRERDGAIMASLDLLLLRIVVLRSEEATVSRAVPLSER